jgi:hypothetical protein
VGRGGEGCPSAPPPVVVLASSWMGNHRNGNDL